VKTLVLLTGHAALPLLGFAESTPPQGDRAVPAPPGSANARTAADPGNSALTLETPPEHDGDGSIPSADPGTVHVPPHASSLPHPGPAEAGLLHDAFQFDSAALEGPVRDFFARLNSVGNVLGVSPTSVSLYYWLLSAGAAGAAWALVRRRRHTRGFDPADAAFVDLDFPWESDGAGTSEETLS
jgi:hypothetical protein